MIQRIYPRQTFNPYPRRLIEVPILNLVAAGDRDLPFADADGREYATVWSTEVNGPPELVRVCGHSMDDNGPRAIRDGELVLLNPTQLRPILGGVYVIRLDGQNTYIKEYRRTRAGLVFYSLSPEQDLYPPIRHDARVEVLGAVYGRLQPDHTVELLPWWEHHLDTRQMN